jgi:hypothetical protein
MSALRPVDRLAVTQQLDRLAVTHEKDRVLVLLHVRRHNSTTPLFERPPTPKLPQPS